MFSFFSKLFSTQEQEILTDKYIIRINDYTYDIPSQKSFEDLKTEFMSYVLSNKLEQATSTDHKYNISFINTDKVQLQISVTKREYVAQLLDNINHNILNNNLAKLTIFVIFKSLESYCTSNS